MAARKAEPGALVEELIDLANRPPAVARGAARSDGRVEAGVGRSLLPHAPADEAFGLARKVRQGGIEGLEPADDPRRADQAISGI